MKSGCFLTLTDARHPALLPSMQFCEFSGSLPNGSGSIRRGAGGMLLYNSIKRSPSPKPSRFRRAWVLTQDEKP